MLATQSPRFFGFVIGGTHPVALAADWLTSAWDQNAGMHAVSPAASVVERVVADWLLQLLRLPPESSVGLVTGGQMATWTCLAAARHKVLADVGWDVERAGLRGAPRVHVVAGAERHGTVDRALRFLGIGCDDLHEVEVDDQGRMRPDRLGPRLAQLREPTVVVAEAGNVNTGAFDPLPEVVAAAHRQGARGFPVWATLAALGRSGVADLVDRLCDRAQQFAGALAATEGVAVLNEVVLNQVLVRVTGGADPDRLTEEVLARIQADGTCWMSGTTWHGRPAMRISVCHWATTAADVGRSVEAIRRCVAAAEAPHVRTPAQPGG